MSMDAEIAKVDGSLDAEGNEKRIIGGWAYVSKRADGSWAEDSQGDIIEPEDLEEAARVFLKEYREANAMHAGPRVGDLTQSVVTMPETVAAWGVDPGKIPVGWWIEFHVTDDDAWEGVKSGKYRMFSIEGSGTREKVE